MHFKTVIEKYPPEVADSVSFQEWMCKVHNAVNEKLGKEIFDCAKVDERWGGVECFGEDGSSEGGCSFEDAPKESPSALNAMRMSYRFSYIKKISLEHYYY